MHIGMYVIGLYAELYMFYSSSLFLQNTYLLFSFLPARKLYSLLLVTALPRLYLLLHINHFLLQSVYFCVQMTLEMTNHTDGSFMSLPIRVLRQSILLDYNSQR